MPEADYFTQKSCETRIAEISNARKKLPKLMEAIVSHSKDETCLTHVDYEPFPSRDAVKEIIDKIRELLFPGYFTRGKIDPVNLTYSLGNTVSDLFDQVSVQIARGFRHDCVRFDLPCVDCEEQGKTIALDLMSALPGIRRVLATDVQAAFDGDPAAKSMDEIIFSYPGMYAITVHRVAHFLYQKQVPLLPRIMSEHAHSKTGIDIHPGAEIGDRFVIDHGTGVVVGETARIGNNVRIYQGVTLGALSLPPGAGHRLKGKRRHPAIEDDVILYSNATILGGETIIGKGCVVGGNVWLTESVPPHTTVVLEKPRLRFKTEGEDHGGNLSFH